MPNRILRDSTRSSRTLAKLSDFGERGFFRLVLMADDYGRFEADPIIIRAQGFTMMPSVTEDMCAQMLRECVAVGLIFTYEVDGRPYGQFVKADKHFSRRAKHSKYPSATQTQSIRIADAMHMRPRVEESRNEESRNEDRGVAQEDFNVQLSKLRDKFGAGGTLP